MIVAIWGHSKTAKSTLGLTYPKPLHVFDFDLRLDGPLMRFEDDVANGLITSTQYPIPPQLEPKGGKIMGMKELWYDFQKEFMQKADDPRMATLMIDTHTQAYECRRYAYIQELQERQEVEGGGKLRPGASYRQSLQPIEYGDGVYHYLKALIFYARAKKKHLILTHSAADVYVDRMSADGRKESIKTEKIQLAGPHWTEQIVDIVMFTYVAEEADKVVPRCKIVKSGIGLELQNQDIAYPSYDGIIAMRKMLKG